MANFKYKAKDNFGVPVNGTMFAESKEAVASNLKKRNYIPISITEARVFEPPTLFKRVKLEDLNLFTRQLWTLQRSGVPILLSLESIRDETNNPFFKQVIQDIIKDIEGGLSLSKAISRNPLNFSEVYVNMVLAGETAGILDEVLERLATLGEYELELRQKIIQATRYPMIVLIAICLAFPLAIVFIIPKFSSLFSRFEVALPLPTRILIGANFIITHYWFFIIGVSILLIFSFKSLIATEQGRAFWDLLKLKLPVFGRLNQKIIMSRFCRLSSVLLRSGISMIETFRIVSASLGNRVISRSIDRIVELINEGRGVAEAMRQSALFSPIVVQMAKIGEESGKIDELLLRVGEYFDSQIDYTVKNLVTLLEPLLIFILGMMVLVLALSIFLPMWNLVSLFKH